MWRAFHCLIRKSAAARFRRKIKNALALQGRGEARRDGLTIHEACTHLAVTWWARDIHPWDRNDPPHQRSNRFVQQALNDTDAAIKRLFSKLPQLDVISVKVLDRESETAIVEGIVHRSSIARNHLSVRMRLIDWGLRLYSDNSHFEVMGD